MERGGAPPFWKVSRRSVTRMDNSWAVANRWHAGPRMPPCCNGWENNRIKTIGKISRESKWLVVCVSVQRTDLYNGRIWPSVRRRRSLWLQDYGFVCRVYVSNGGLMSIMLGLCRTVWSLSWWVVTWIWRLGQLGKWKGLCPQRIRYIVKESKNVTENLN